RAGKPDLAQETIRKAVESHTNEVPPLACQVEVLHAAGKDKEAQEAFTKLSALCAMDEPGVPCFDRVKALAADWCRLGWTAPSVAANADHEPKRIDLKTLGTLCWLPYQAEQIALRDTENQVWNLSANRGRNILVLFYLGGKCAHCLQQLQEFGKEFEAFKALNTDIVAISTDDLATT